MEVRLQLEALIVEGRLRARSLPRVESSLMSVCGITEQLEEG